MQESDYCQEACHHSPNYQDFYNLNNGYCGKPTKLRTSQPTMFQILTWNQQDLKQQRQKQSKEMSLSQFKCKCKRNFNSPEKGQSPNGHLNNQIVSSKKVKQNQNKVLQNQSKQYKQSNSKQKNVQNKFQKPFDSQNRPKSAGANTKSVKIITSPAKLPKFIGQQLKRQQQQRVQQPIQNKQKLIQKFKQTTRWIPNSSFTTYFGKPAFENYGRGNTNPTFGGLMYGNYLKTHNIQPHRGINSPKNLQSYNVALLKAQQIGQIHPYPPKINKKDFHTSKDISQSGDLQCTQIYAENNNLRSFPIHPPNLYDLQKFGGKGIQKVSKPRLQRSQIGKQNQFDNDELKSYEVKQSVNGSRKQVY